jgi:hypothetical protein
MRYEVSTLPAQKSSLLRLEELWWLVVLLVSVDRKTSLHRRVAVNITVIRIDRQAFENGVKLLTNVGKFSRIKCYRKGFQSYRK